jgi:hypothetical protein
VQVSFVNGAEQESPSFGLVTGHGTGHRLRLQLNVLLIDGVANTFNFMLLE